MPPLRPDRVNKLADYLESTPGPFSYATYECFIGWAERLFGLKTSRELAEYLGLTETQRTDLCYDWPDIELVDKAEAVRVLRNLAKTGEVTWH